MRSRPGFYLLLCTALLAVSCGTLNPGSSRSPEMRLMETYREWSDTPYTLGGNDQSGVDCSGFIKIAMEENFRVSLPRTTSEQIRRGTNVSKRFLRTGDLVFFDTGPLTYHVGIMVGTRRFIHASYSSGVTIDRIDQTYWSERFYAGRRVI